MTLAPIDPTSAVAVTSYLENAKTWLATAVENTGPADIAAARAELATAAEATKQLHLSRDIQHDADEMVRRAEWALGRSIREGQIAGEIETKAEATRRATKLREVKAGRADQSDVDILIKPKPTDFGTHTELYKHNGEGILGHLADATSEELEQALEEARAEGNLSRANVVRKVKAQSDCDRSPVVTRDMRADLIRDLAEQGYSSRQMPAKVGVTEESVRKIARDFDIEIPADRSVRGSRRVDSSHIVANTVTALEGLVMGVELVVIDDLDPQEASQWADSLNHSLRALNRFVKQIKETTHD